MRCLAPFLYASQYPPPRAIPGMKFLDKSELMFYHNPVLPPNRRTGEASLAIFNSRKTAPSASSAFDHPSKQQHNHPPHLDNFIFRYRRPCRRRIVPLLFPRINSPFPLGTPPRHSPLIPRIPQSAIRIDNQKSTITNDPIRSSSFFRKTNLLAPPFISGRILISQILPNLKSSIKNQKSSMPL